MGRSAKKKIYPLESLGYGLDGTGVVVRFSTDFTFLHSVEIRFEARLASYSVGNGGAFPGGKAAEM
jgi:hypothetical protein